MKNSISLRYKNSIISNKSDHAPDNANGVQIVLIVSSLMHEMINLGYLPSLTLINDLISREYVDCRSTCTSILQNLKEFKGANVEYVPFYPNFPDQVAQKSEADLFFTACVYYATFGIWQPEYVKHTRHKDIESVDFTTIGVINEVEFETIFTKIVNSNDSISQTDVYTIEWFMSEYSNFRIEMIPETIPFKEIQCIVLSKLIESNVDITKYVTSATDILRIATYMSGGDISLAGNTRFYNFSRPMRKVLVTALESVINEEDINRHRNKWVRLMHQLHVGDYSKKVYEVAKKIRNNEKIVTYYGRVQSSIDTRNLSEVLRLLSSRPSEFGRRLDYLLRTFKDNVGEILNVYQQIGSDIPSRILAQIMGHFHGICISTDNNTSIVFPKGLIQRAIKIQNKLEDKDLACLVYKITYHLMVNRIKSLSLPPLGKVWIDPKLINCPVPSAQRSASNSLKTLARGTRMPIGNKNTLRFFIYWVGQDIDLSASFLNKDFEFEGHISYTKLKNSCYEAYHSGDIISAPNGASEFIDISLDKLVNTDIRYVVMNVFVFNGPNFKDHDVCYVGWMTRDYPKSNEIYEPSTVEQKVDLRSDCASVIPVIFDVVTREFIWIDLPTPSMGRYDMYDYWHNGNNVENNRAGISNIVESIANMSNKIPLLTLFSAHTEARGTRVDEKDQADTIFSISEGITPFDMNIINSDYLV